jgi:putative hydrolase
MVLMTVLEGHADVVMDLAGPGVVPSVALIRERFEARRDAAHGVDRIVRTLLGVEAKVRQYRDGATFIRSLMQAGGMAQVNELWSGPEALPSLEEIAAPARWWERTAA